MSSPTPIDNNVCYACFRPDLPHAIEAYRGAELITWLCVDCGMNSDMVLEFASDASDDFMASRLEVSRAVAQSPAMMWVSLFAESSEMTVVIKN